MPASSLVRTIPAEIPEARAGEFEIIARDTYFDTVPAYVMRAEASDNRRETAMALAIALTETTGIRYVVAADLETDIAQIRDHGIGILHDDYDPSLIVFGSYSVHETIRGIGLLTVANSGPAYAKRDVSVQERAGELLKKGLTDPEIMDCHISSAILAPGDKVISPIANQLGPVWHRYDTLVGPREAHAALIVPSRDLGA